ncbi:Calcium-independent phospholipase A2-gamma [Aphelenchoides bicaudatus]|nr:Calcium-independent phospholipase A2-gamma [Aphelenchoides bicaudatus]
MSSAIVNRFARFGIFTNKRIPPIEAAAEALKNVQLASKIEENAEKSKSEKAVEVKNEDEAKAIEQKANSKPSYLGYLSGVVSTLWSPGTKIGQEVVQHVPLLEKSKPKVIVKKVSRQEVVLKTKELIKLLLTAETSSSRLHRTEELSKHLMEYPASRFVLVQDNPETISFLLKQLDSSMDETLKGETRVCLYLCGYVEPPKAKGVRILTIDGGGTRALMSLETLSELEKNLGGKLIDNFDLIAGVSTGAIIATLLGALHLSVSQAKEIYMELSRQLFKQSKISGVSGLIMAHSYYNTKKWVEIIKNVIGEDVSLMDIVRGENAVRLAIVSCIVNAPQLQPFVFRNYEHPGGRDSQFRGGTKHKLWEAVLLGTLLHQDGGVLANNPTAIALHEARLLWPNEPIQCVCSIGNGRSVMEYELTSTLANTGIQDKITKIIDSATDTELIHMTMSDLLDPRIYFRLNPYMSFPYTLDEIDPAKLEQMNKDAKSYVRRNKLKIRGAALQLSRPAPIHKAITRNLKRLRDRQGMYKPE